MEALASPQRSGLWIHKIARYKRNLIIIFNFFIGGMLASTIASSEGSTRSKPR
jgi:hypothetical protein